MPVRRLASLRRTALAAALAPALLLGSAPLAGCATSGVNRGDVNLVSLQEEWQLGEQYHQQISRQMRLSSDATLTAYVNEVGQRLVRQTELANLPWRFYVVDDASVNAFNIPGGRVYVHTGLIARAGSASELAAAMAHEVMHGASRHGTERLTKAQGVNVLGSILLGRNGGAARQIGTEVAAAGLMARFSRSDESEADREGLRILRRAGYDARGMVEVFRTLLATQQSRPGAVQQFFSTHPVTQDRLRAMEAQIQREGLTGGRRDEAGFTRARSRAGGR